LNPYLAHELGHWHFNHVLKNLIIAQIHFFTMFYVFSQTIDMKSLYTAFGFNTKPVLIGFILFQFLYTPFETVIGFLMNYWTRQKEFQADQFATELGYGSKLKSGLTKLLSDNLAVFNPDEWHSMWHLSHPPLIERLNAIDKVKVKSKK
jgi:STE24 endopeptidase